MRKPAKKQHRKTDYNWALVRDDFVRCLDSVVAVAKRHNVPRSTAQRRFQMEGWADLRMEWQASVSAQAAEEIRQRQVADHIRLYDATRKAADNLIAQLLRAAEDPDGLFRHVVQMVTEEEEGSGAGRIRRKKQWVEDSVLDAINGRNAADMARALKDLATMARTLDGIMDASQKAKLDLERDRLALDRQRTGLDTDMEQESGIAYITPRDPSLLDGALPDPGEDSLIEPAPPPEAKT